MNEMTFPKLDRERIITDTIKRIQLEQLEEAENLDQAEFFYKKKEIVEALFESSVSKKSNFKNRFKDKDTNPFSQSKSYLKRID